MVMIKFGKKGLSRIWKILIGLGILIIGFMGYTLDVFGIRTFIDNFFPTGSGLMSYLGVFFAIFIPFIIIFIIFRIILGHDPNSLKEDDFLAFIFSVVVLTILWGVLEFTEILRYEDYFIFFMNLFESFIIRLDSFIPGFASIFETDFMTGLIVGLILWAFYFIYATYQQLINWIKEKTPGTGDGEVIRENKNEWLKFVAGRIWKIPLIGIAYLTLKTIPFVRNVVEIITLEIFGASGWLLILIICIELGFGPALYEWWKLTKFKTKVSKRVSAIKTAAELDKIKAGVD